MDFTLLSQDITAYELYVKGDPRQRSITDPADMNGIKKKRR